MEHHDVVISGIFADKRPAKHPWQWTKPALNTLVEAVELYMVSILAEFHFKQQQLVSPRFSAY